ncbi:unnamed protein product, partial [Prorocentrum cordatum]
MRIPLLSTACTVALVAGLLVDVGAAVKLRHERGRQRSVDPQGGDLADGDQESEGVSHFLPSTNVTCFQGKTAAMASLLESLRTGQPASGPLQRDRAEGRLLHRQRVRPGPHRH